MEENLFVNLEHSPVSMQLHGFLPENKKTKNQKESDTLMDWYLRSKSCQFFIQKLPVLHYADST